MSDQIDSLGRFDRALAQLGAVSKVFFSFIYFFYLLLIGML